MSASKNGADLRAETQIFAEDPDVLTVRDMRRQPTGRQRGIRSDRCWAKGTVGRFSKPVPLARLDVSGVLQT